MVMSVRQSAEFDHALERAGFTPALVKQLSTGDTLSSVLDVLQGRSRIMPIELPEHTLDGDADPFDPDLGLVVGFNQKMGPLRIVRRGDELFVNGKRVILVAPKVTRKHPLISAKQVSEQLKGKRILNAIVYKFLATHPEYIPRSWEDTSLDICFWGTAFVMPDLTHCIRYLHWNGNEYGWQENYHVCDLNWQDRYVAATLED